MVKMRAGQCSLGDRVTRNIMAALVEGRQYGLSSLVPTSAEKSVVYCKLTDSALKAFEEFQDLKASTGQPSTIQFNASKGVIKVPTKKAAGAIRVFEFNLSTVPGDPNGSFDCVHQHNGSSNQGDMSVVGSMTYKVNVSATDDVYQTTRDKMTLAEEESKKQGAKEIKAGGPNMGRKIKKVVKRNVVENRLAEMTSRSNTGSDYSPMCFHQPPKHSINSQHSPKNATGQPKSIENFTERSKSSQESKSASQNSDASSDHISASKDSRHSGSSQSNPVANKSLTANPVANKSLTANPTLMNMPYRERVLHLLALRPYKKPELLARLQRDGIRDKDKERNALTAILREAAVFHTRDNSFGLNRHLYNEVRPNWPFYTEADKALLKKRMAQIKDPATLPSPAVSPCHSNQGSPGNASTQAPPPASTTQLPAASQPHAKRASTASGDNPVPMKKQRIAHSRQGASESQPSHQPNGIMTSLHSADRSSRKSDEDGRSPDLPSPSQENNNYLQPEPSVITAEYAKKYTAIASREQRHKYKGDFNQQYQEYCRLHTDIEKVTRIFQDLRDRLKEHEYGTGEYDKVKRQIMSEYNNVKQDAKYQEQRRRHDYLHHKLGHIKRLICDYDLSIIPAS